MASSVGATAIDAAAEAAVAAPVDIDTAESAAHAGARASAVPANSNDAEAAGITDPTAIGDAARSSSGDSVAGATLSARTDEDSTTVDSRTRNAAISVSASGTSDTSTSDTSTSGTSTSGTSTADTSTADTSSSDTSTSTSDTSSSGTSSSGTISSVTSSCGTSTADASTSASPHDSTRSAGTGDLSGHDLDSAAAPSPAAEPLPGFLLRARRVEAARRRWRLPLALAAAALFALLAGQFALQLRDSIAAAWPATRPPLEAACAVLGCRVQAPLRIDEVSVEAVTLRRIDDGSRYLLQLALRSRAPYDVRMPAIDLTLTDLQGRTVLRRMLAADELGATSERLQPHREVMLQALVDLGDLPVVGYTAELFYP